MDKTQEPLVRTDTPTLDRQPGNSEMLDRQYAFIKHDTKPSCWSPVTKTGFQRWSIGLGLLGLIFLAIFLWSLFDHGPIALTVIMGAASFLVLVYSIVGLIWFQPDEDC